MEEGLGVNFHILPGNPAEEADTFTASFEFTDAKEDFAFEDLMVDNRYPGLSIWGEGMLQLGEQLKLIQPPSTCVYSIFVSFKRSPSKENESL